MHIGIDVKCMHTDFDGCGPSGFGDIAIIQFYMYKQLHCVASFQIPHGCNGHPQLLEIKNIAQILLEQRKTFLEGKGIENLIEEEEDGADATMETERNEMVSGTLHCSLKNACPKIPQNGF